MFWPQFRKCWDETTSRIQMLRHFDFAQCVSDWQDPVRSCRTRTWSGSAAWHAASFPRITDTVTVRVRVRVRVRVTVRVGVRVGVRVRG